MRGWRGNCRTRRTREPMARVLVLGPGGPGDRGAADTYYQQPYGQQDPYVQQPGYGQQSPSPAGMYGDPNGPGSQSKGAGGLLGKLLGKNKPQQQISTPAIPSATILRTAAAARVWIPATAGHARTEARRWLGHGWSRRFRCWWRSFGRHAP